MQSGQNKAPDWVGAILEWRWTWLISRLCLTSLFLVSAVVEVGDFSTAAAIQAGFGLHPGWLWASVTILFQVIGSLIIVSGRRVWLGAGILAAFTCATEIVAHRFWELKGTAEFAARNEFFEHLGLIAGLVMVAQLAEQRNRTLARACDTALNDRFGSDPADRSSLSE